MEIISLRGPQNSGKTTTLTIVHDKLLKQSSQNSNNCFKEISNGDFLDVIEYNGRKVGIVTQGDYSRGECSVKNHLRELKNLGCDVAICACTIGYGKDSIQAAIKHILCTITLKRNGLTMPRYTTLPIMKMRIR